MTGISDGDRLRLMGTDGQAWAEEFARHAAFTAVRNQLAGHTTIASVLDIDFLRGWFANAIEAGRDAGAAELGAARADAARWRAVAADLAEAIRVTREYVGTDTLPPGPAWEWWAATNRYREAAGQPPLADWLPADAGA